VDEGNRVAKRSRETEDERSAECGRARNAGSLTEDAAEITNGIGLVVCDFGGVFRQRHGWLRQPPAARIAALLVSVPPASPVDSVPSVPSVSVPSVPGRGLEASAFQRAGDYAHAADPVSGGYGGNGNGKDGGNGNGGDGGHRVNRRSGGTETSRAAIRAAGGWRSQPWR